MNVGVIGLGALGLPLAVGFAVKGHTVRGYDVRPERMRDDWFKEKESGWPVTQTFQQTLLDAHIQFVPMEEVLADSEVVFVVVQTPNEDGFDGTTILTDQRRNYDLGPLNRCLTTVAEWVDNAPEDSWPELAIISTLLPGTMRTLHEKYFAKHTALAVAHTPMFCAMGTVLPDLFDPEWFVVGETEDYGYRRPWKILEALDSLAGVGTCRVIGWTDSEIVKTCYNVFITMKINYANMVMEVAHRAGGDCDRVADTLMRANARLISPRYLRGGMGDGGGCLPGNQLIYTTKGMVPIEKVRVGDYVLAGDGRYHTVTKTYVRDYHGDMNEIVPRGLPYVALTDAHPVLVADDLRKIYTWNGKEKHDGRKTVDNAVGEPYYVPASEVSRDHYMLFPKPVTPDSDIQLDPLYERIAGYYLSEGSIEWRRDRSAYGRVAFHFHEREFSYRDDVSGLVEQRFGIRGTEQKRRNCVSLRFSCQEMAERLDSDFGRGSSSKKLPAWVLNGCEATAANLLYGMFRGDGSAFAYGYTYSTTSENLAYGAHLLLKKLGVPSRIKRHLKRDNGFWHRESWDVVVSNARDLAVVKEAVAMPIKHKMQTKRYNHVFEKDGNFYHKVKKVTRYEVTEKVYNLEVSGEPSYVTVAGTVHNCHGKENMALSWWAREHNMSYDFFEANMKCRQEQTYWLAKLVYEAATDEDVSDIWLLGTAFKPETNLEDGSPALLLADMIARYFPNRYTIHLQDPEAEDRERTSEWDHPIAAVISCKHQVYRSYRFPAGSVVVDPHRYIVDQPGVRVIRVGAP